MLDHAVMKSVAEQLMSAPEVEVEGHKFRVTRIGSRRFRTVRFVAGGEKYQAIERTRKSLAGGDSWRGRGIGWCSFGISRRRTTLRRWWISRCMPMEKNEGRTN